MKATRQNWNDIGYIKRSRRRLKALEILAKPQMPSELAREMEISLTHASKICRELYRKKLVTCLNKSLTVGRIYRSTERGKKALEGAES